MKVKTSAPLDDKNIVTDWEALFNDFSDCYQTYWHNSHCQVYFDFNNVMWLAEYLYGHNAIKFTALSFCDEYAFRNTISVAMEQYEYDEWDDKGNHRIVKELRYEQESEHSFFIYFFFEDEED